MVELDRLAREDFLPHVGTTFDLDLGGGQTLGLVLAAADPLGSETVPEAVRKPFALTFRTPGERRHAPQAIYTLRHAAFGELPIFLVPLGPDAGGMRYEAVFT
jgi:hypothetical protein